MSQDRTPVKGKKSPGRNRPIARTTVAEVVFESGNKDYPNQRVAWIAREVFIGKMPNIEDLPRRLMLRPFPATLFKPKAGKGYDLDIELYKDVRDGKTRYSAYGTPLMDTQVLTDEFLPARQTIMKVTFEKVVRPDRSFFLRFVDDSGLFYVPCWDWPLKMAAIYHDMDRPIPQEGLEPKATERNEKGEVIRKGEEYWGIPQEQRNRVVLVPAASPEHMTSSGSTELAFASLENQRWYALHVMSPNGRTWYPLGAYLGLDSKALVGGTVSKKEINEAAITAKREIHPDHQTDPMLKAKADRKVACVGEAQKKALAWPAKKAELDAAEAAEAESEAHAEGKATAAAQVAAAVISRPVRARGTKVESEATEAPANPTADAS